MSVRDAFLTVVLLGSTAALSSAQAAEERSLTGQVTYEGQARLPMSTVVHVSLDDVSLADAPAVTIGETEFSPVSQKPFFYTLRYDPDRLVAGHRYTLHAQIRVGGALLYTTQTATLATGEVPASTTLVVDRIASAIPAEIVGSWSISLINGRKPIKEAPAFMTLGADGHVSGTGGCNRMMGQATTAGHKFRFGPMAGTRMACIGPRMTQEDAVAKAMQNVVSWTLKGDVLGLENAHGKTLLTLVPVQTPTEPAHNSSPNPSMPSSSRNIP